MIKLASQDQFPQSARTTKSPVIQEVGEGEGGATVVRPAGTFTIQANKAFLGVPKTHESQPKAKRIVKSALKCF